MRSTPRGDAVMSGPIRTSELSEADRVLLLAMRAWTEPAARAGEDDGAGLADADGFRSRLWDRLAPSWGQRLHDAWERDSTAAGSTDPLWARDQLRRAHQAEARVDPRRVHPSWWVRALREESPAVQRVVAASAPEQVRHSVQAGLLLDSQDLVADRPAAAEILGWVSSLWTERLVGGEPERADDPPAIMILSRLSLRAGYRLCRWAGLTKHALADRERAGDGGVPPSRRARGEWLRDRLSSVDPEFGVLAERDVRSNPTSKWPRRRHAARLGLLTIARLLADCEPFRVRWALQHWPYTIAKLTRSLMTPLSQRSTTLSAGESLVLKTAWDRLNLEGRLPMAWPGPE